MVPGGQKREHGHRDDSGTDGGHYNAPQDMQSGGALEQRCFLHFLIDGIAKILYHPNPKGQHQTDLSQDKPGKGVEQPQRTVHDVEGHDDGDVRKHLRIEQEHQQGLSTREGKSRETVAGRSRQHNRNQSHPEGHPYPVGDVGNKLSSHSRRCPLSAQLWEGIGLYGKRAGEPIRGSQLGFLVGAQRRGEDPEHRKHHNQYCYQQNDVSHRLRDKVERIV